MQFCGASIQRPHQPPPPISIGERGGGVWSLGSSSMFKDTWESEEEEPWLKNLWLHPALPVFAAALSVNAGSLDLSSSP